MDNSIFAYMIGPKGENFELFRRMVLQVLDDHVFWRRNFYPQDVPAMTTGIQMSSEYQHFVATLQDNLFYFLSEAKKGVPFFSPRYIGHMNTDLLLPAMIGYFGAMLANSNNIAGVSSPVTAKQEKEVIEMLLRMVGMKTERGWGYLTAGGTTANMFGLWIARNLRTLPISIRLMLEDNAKAVQAEVMQKSVDLQGVGVRQPIEKTIAETIAALRENLAADTARGEKKLLSKMTLWELANIPSEELCDLRKRAINEIGNKINVSENISAVLFDKLSIDYQLKTSGILKFCDSARKTFGEQANFLQGIWRIYRASNSHYSWVKGLDILGLGHNASKDIPHRTNFDMNIDSLNRILLDDIQNNQSVWPLILVSTFGTTEEGAIDDLPGILQLRQDLAQKHGLTIWLHVDAAYGGYLGAMLRRHEDSGEPGDVGQADHLDTFKNWLAECGQTMGLSTQNASDLVEMSEMGDGWLKWQEFIQRAKAMSKADSLSLDPHKLGYIPYPAGAILLRAGSGRDTMSIDAPYLWTNETEAEAFTGRYTLEGSRPGAAAAACWLAHKTIPLNQTGHGRLLAMSILAARQLYQSLKVHLNRPDQEARVAIIHRPHTNMICYIPYHTDHLTSQGVQELTKSLLQKLNPANEIRPFMAVETDLALCNDLAVEEGLAAHSPFQKMLQDSPNTSTMTVIRSVVMGPFSLNAQTRAGKLGELTLIFDLYAQYLKDLIQTTAQELTVRIASKNVAQWRRSLKCMVMDDDSTVSNQLRNMLAVLHDPRILDFWEYCSTEQAALEFIQDYNIPIDIVFLDIDMSGSSEHRCGHRDAGYKIYETILKRNSDIANMNFRIQAVFFFTKGYSGHNERIAEINMRYDNASRRTKVLTLHKDNASPKASELIRRQMADKIIREIGRLEHPEGE